MVGPFLRTGFNYDRDEVSRDTGIAPGGKSLTVQSDTPGTDINLIVKRFTVTGELPIRQMPPVFDELEVDDLKDALNLVRRADEAFMSQPAEVRAKFDNDPVKYVKYCEENFEKPEKMKEIFPDWHVPVPKAEDVVAKA